MPRSALAVGWQAVAVACAAWLTGASMTGQRYPGLSLAWLAPATAGGVLAVAMLLAVAGLEARLGRGRGHGRARGQSMAVWTAAASMLVGGVVAVLLLSSNDANHYFANWVRLRLGLLLLVWGLVGTCGMVAVMRLIEERYGALSRLGRRAGWPTVVFVGCLLVYLASAGGHLYSVDEWTIYASAVGLAQHGIPAAYDGQPYPLHLLGIVRQAREADAVRAYPKYGILPALVAAPAVLIARVVTPDPTLPAGAFPFPNLALPLVPIIVNPLVTAATAALLYRVGRALGYGHRAALGATAAFAFGSLAWPYTKTLLNMNLAAGALLATLGALLAAETEGRRRRWLFGAGVAAGLAVATRYEVALLVAPLGVLVFRRWATMLRDGAVALAGAAIVTGPLVLVMNVLRTGNALDAGYGAEGSIFSVLEKPWYGWLAQLLSPECGITTHTPVMLVGLLGTIWLWEDRPRVALAVGGSALLGLFYYSSLSTTWCAYATWGPRYTITVAPFMALPIAALASRLGSQQSAKRNPFLWLIGGGVFGWSVLTNLLAVLVDFNRGWQDHWAHGVTFMEVVWIPFWSGITSHTRLLRQWLLDGTGGLDLYWLYAAGPLGQVLLVVFCLGALACWTALWLGDGGSEERTTRTAGDQEYAEGFKTPT